MSDAGCHYLSQELLFILLFWLLLYFLSGAVLLTSYALTMFIPLYPYGPIQTVDLRCGLDSMSFLFSEK